MRLSKLVPRLSLLLLLPVFSALTSSLAIAQLSDPTLSEAQRLLKQGQHAQALSKVDTYLGSKPKEPQGRFTKGLILTEMKRTPEAILVFKKLTEDFPELPEPYNNLAVLYAQEKQYEKAKQALESAIKTHPSYAVAHENLGDIYAKLASQAYGKALQIDAGNTAAQTKMAMIRDLAQPSTVATVAAVGKPNAKSPADPIRLASNDPNRVSAAPAAPAPSMPAAPTKPAAPPPPAAPPTPVIAPAAPVIAAPNAAPAAEHDVSKALNAWASAWSRKDVKAYLASYAPDFQTPGGQARRAWENEREARINKPGKIEVGVDKVSVELNGNDKATVKFRQSYKSATLKSSAAKTVFLVRNNGRWLIQQERVN